MTPIEELKKGLDELCVEYDTYDLPNGEHGLSWIDGNDIEWEVVQQGENFRIHALQLVTPEQAIAATVGAGTCHDADVGGYFVCSECEALVKLHSIGRSYVDGHGKRWYATSNNHSLNFCPNCGRRIEVNE